MIDNLIVGTGRCGTGYTSKILEVSGVVCYHEGIFNPFTLSHFWVSLMSEDCEKLDIEPFSEYCNEFSGVSESSWLAVPYLALIPYRNLVHVIRNPLEVFRNWLFDLDDIFTIGGSSKSSYGQFILDHCPEIKKERDPVVRALLFYRRWQNKIELYPRTLYRVEDNCFSLFVSLGIQNLYNQEKINMVSRKYNSRTKSSVTLKEVWWVIEHQTRELGMTNELWKYYPEYEEVYCE